jgi:hypothetical protein
MIGRKILPLLLILSVGLTAFSPPILPPSDKDAGLILQYLTVVNADRSVEFSYILKIRPSAADDMIQNYDYTRENLCADVTSQTTDTLGHFKQKEHGEDIWCVSKQSPDTIEELKVWMDDQFSITIVRLEIVKGKFYFDIRWGSFPCGSNDPAEFSCEWAVQAPGKIGDNNATRVEGRTLIWVMTDPDGPNHFTAESSASSGFLGMDPAFAAVLFSLTCCCCIIILLAGGGLTLFLIYRRKKAAPDQEEADSSSSSGQSIPSTPASSYPSANPPG